MNWFDSFPTAKVGDFTMLIDPVDTTIGNSLKTDGYWEPLGTRLVEREFTGGVFVDAGAHWGYYSLLASKRASRVYAFEANPYNFRYLFLNIVMNNLGNVVPYPLALWKEPAVLQGDFKNGASSNTGGTGVGVGDGGPRIQAVPLDSLDLGDVGFIKIDAEGSDGDILRGALGTIKKSSPGILVESPPAEFLHDLGYRMVEDVGGGTGPLTYWRKG